MAKRNMTLVRLEHFKNGTGMYAGKNPPSERCLAEREETKRRLQELRERQRAREQTVT